MRSIARHYEPAAGMLCRHLAAVLCLLTVSSRVFASDAMEFALLFQTTGKYYGMYDYTNNAPILNGKGTLLVGTGRTFRIELCERGLVLPYGPFAFTNMAPVQLGKHPFTLVTRGLYGVRGKLAQQAAAEAAFKDAQRAKGLVEWNGVWVSSNSLRVAQERVAAVLLPAEKRLAAIPVKERCRMCGGMGLVQQGTEIIEGISMLTYSNCPCCKETGREPVAPPAEITTPNTPNPAVAGTDSTPLLKPVHLKGPTRPGGGTKHLGDE